MAHIDRRNWRAALAVVALLGLGAHSPIARHGDVLVRSKLYQTSRARLAMARARSARMFSVMLASAPGKNVEVAAAIAALGGKVDWQADDVDYLRATLPIDTVETLANRNDIVSIDADDSITVLSPTPAMAPSPASGAPVPPPRTAADEGPLLHPYLPGRHIGTLALRAAHPTYDGRGTTVAVIDGTPDFLLPELRYGKTVDGKLVPKYVDIRVGEDPKSEDHSSSSYWLHTMPVHAANRAFTANGISYRAPYNGDFRFAALTTKEAYSPEAYYWKEMYPDLKPAKDAVLFAALWDERSGIVWTDIGSPRDFSKAAGLHDYHVNYDYGIASFRPKDPEARASIGYVVQTDIATHKVAILFGLASHSTSSAGSVAASRDGGGRIEGIAPGARLYAITPGDNASSIIESVITAARNPHVDAIDLETMSADSYATKDGRFTESVIFDRVVRKFGKPVLQPAGNDFGLGQVAESCVPATVLCVGAYENRDSYLVNAGIQVAQRDNLHFVDSFGPTGTGELKPDILAPSGWITLAPVTSSRGLRKGLYNLPPGYLIFGGTSQATPTAAGAIAVLISAARQEGLHVTPQQLIAAVTQGARYMNNLPAYVQGNGLIQIDAALRWLELHNGQSLPHLTFDAPVSTVTSWMLSKPNRGVGLFEREGWIAGDRGTRTMFAIRTNGVPVPQFARIELIGNDGTFTVPPTIMLPRARPVALQIEIAPKQPGVHSAILRLRSHSGEMLGETLLTIVAAEQFTTRNGFTITHHLNVPRPGETSFFVTVPKGTQVLTIRMTSPRAALAGAFLSYNAWLPDSTQSLNVSNNLLISFPFIAGARQDVFPHPQPGTWEIVFTDTRDYLTYEMRHIHPTPITVTASIANPPILTVTHQPAAVASYATMLRAGQQRVYDIHVPQNATGIGAQLASEYGTSLNMYLFDCTKPADDAESRRPVCIIVMKSTETSSKQHLYYDHPAAGVWKLVVDGYLASPHGTSYQLSDYYLEGIPSSESDRRSVPAVTFGTLGNAPLVWYNEGNAAGEITARDGLNPIIFDVQLAR